MIGPEHWYTYILIVFVTIIGAALFIVAAFVTQYPMNFFPTRFRAQKRVEYLSDNISSENLTSTTEVSHLYNKQLQEVEHTFNPRIVIDPVDVNDKEIARLESNLKNITTRVESYMLESVLIGSLTFSGFLTIMASVPNVSWKTANLQQLQFVSSASVSHWSLILEQWATNANLFPVIMIESLCCSVFFVLVLALRVRFGTLTLKFDYLLRIMVIFNAKEEELINMELNGIAQTPQFIARKQNLTFKISEAINDANKIMKDIMPLARMMGIYRNIGLMLFFLILITAGLFFSPSIAFGIFLLAIATYIFRLFDAWRSIDKIERLIRRHQ